MGCGNTRWTIKVTHEPTGMSQSISDRDMRSQHKAKQMAIEILTQRLNYVKMSDTTQDIDIIHDYIIDDPLCQYPDDLKDYKLIHGKNPRKQNTK